MARVTTKRVAARRAPARRARRTTPSTRLWEFLRKRAGLLLALTLLAVFLHDVFGARGLLAMRRSQKEVEKIQQEIQQINQENRRLAERVKALKSDPQLIERIAREQMGLARPGERIYRLPAPPQEPTGRAKR
jgi:cell division protein FtsL